MPIVSYADRTQYLLSHYPILLPLCAPERLPSIVSHRMNAELPFCYGKSKSGSPIPVGWDSPDTRVVPLWENANGIVAIRLRHDSLDFVQINFEDPSDVDVIARSINGLLFYVFYFLIESAGDNAAELSEIKQLANCLKFEMLDAVAESVSRLGQQNDSESILSLFRSI